MDNLALSQDGNPLHFCCEILRPHLLGCTVYIVEELLLAVCMFVSCIGMIGYQCLILLVCENLFLNKSPSIC